MLEHLIPDILRAVISTTANVLLLTTLLQPKYSRKVTNLAMLGILAANFGTALFCYLIGNLTLLSKLDILLFTVLCFAVRPLFKDTFMQWLFSYLTVINISEIVIILSFIASRPLPYPIYANSLLRLLLFTAIILGLRRYVIPVYRQAGEHWTAYFAVAMCFNMALSYYFLFSEDIVATLTEHAVPLLLLIFTGLAAYASIFISLKNLKREYQTREENRQMQTEREYLELAAETMSQRLELMEEVPRSTAMPLTTVVTLITCCWVFWGRVKARMLTHCCNIKISQCPNSTKFTAKTPQSTPLSAITQIWPSSPAS